jgi:ankyrin repeat protein
MFLTVLAVTGCESKPPSAGRALRGDVELKQNSRNADAFVQAAAEGKIELITRALNQGMKPDTTNVHGFTALMWSAGQGRDDVVKLVLERGANVHAKARDGSEPLIFAAGYGKISTAQMLITAGANANQPSGHTTPLIAAATGNQPEMVVFLLSQKADINARDSEGCTALFYAANNPKSEDANNATMPLVRILLMPWHSREFVVKDCDGRLLAFGSNL